MIEGLSNVFLKYRPGKGLIEMDVLFRGHLGKEDVYILWRSFGFERFISRRPLISLPEPRKSRSSGYKQPSRDHIRHRIPHRCLADTEDLREIFYTQKVY